jgi:hypothetical protein
LARIFTLSLLVSSQALFIKEFDMLQIFFGIYLVLGLLATLLLWTALAASRRHDMEERYDRPRFDWTALTISNSKNARGEPDLLEDQIVF